jgi:hypothetical protein
LYFYFYILYQFFHNKKLFSATICIQLREAHFYSLSLSRQPDTSQKKAAWRQHLQQGDVGTASRLLVCLFDLCFILFASKK